MAGAGIDDHPQARLTASRLMFSRGWVDRPAIASSVNTVG
jgi:hypothetical protein